MQVANAEIKSVTWDPYEILGVSEVEYKKGCSLFWLFNVYNLQGAPLSEIKKTYKKLSLVYHPDKAKAGEEEKNEERFIDITKAYKV